MNAQKRLTLAGNIVISVGLFGHSGDNEVWENMDEGTLTKTKEMLDDMHKRKIDMADESFVINPGMSIFTGHPWTHLGFLQLRQRCASASASSLL